jgi:hypothetical protein
MPAMIRGIGQFSRVWVLVMALSLATMMLAAVHVRPASAQDGNAPPDMQDQQEQDLLPPDDDGGQSEEALPFGRRGERNAPDEDDGRGQDAPGCPANDRPLELIV